MSIEKFNPRIYGEAIPFTQVNTKVIQEIDNMEAGFVWVYLLSLPPTWKVIKEHVKTHFGMGVDKLKNIFSYLAAHNLIEYTRDRLPNGQLCPVDVHVLNGSRFIKTIETTTGVKNQLVVSHTSGKPTTIKDIDNKDDKKNKEKIERGEKRPPALTSIPLDFKSCENHQFLAKQLNLDLPEEEGNFIDYYDSTGKKMANWDTAFTRWLKKSVQFSKKYQPKEHPVTASIRQLKEKSPEFRHFLLS